MVAMYTIAQRSYVFRNDDGTQVTATWKPTNVLAADQNTAITNVSTDTNLRLRFEIQETGGASGSVTPQLQRNVNGGGFVNVTDVSTVVRASASGVADGTATTNIMTLGTGGFVAGSVDTVDGVAAAISQTASSHTEVEYCFQIRSADVTGGETITFQLVGKSGGATPFDTYTVTPSLTVATPANTGTIASTLPTLSQSATGTVVEAAVTGTIASVLPALTQSATGEIPIPQSVTRAIVAGTDDAIETESPAPATPTLDAFVNLAQVVGQHLGYRLTDLPMQNSATIISAVPSFTLSDSAKNDAEGTWYAHDTDDAATFTTALATISGRTKTTASVAWTNNDLGIAGDRISGPDLAAVIQEVVDRPGWRPGNNIVLIYVHNSATDKVELANLEHATHQEPTLLIEYQAIPITEGLANLYFGFAMQAAGEMAGGAAVTGTAASTLPTLTQSATTTIKATATAASTLQVFTSSATGTIKAAGTAISTLPALTQSAAAGLAAAATAASTLPTFQQAATGALGASGSTASTLPALTQSAFGTVIEPGVPITGTIASTLPAFVQSASGTVFQPATGTIASTLSALTQSADGTVLQAAIGTITSILPGLTQLVIVNIPILEPIPGIPVAVQDPSHEISIRDQLHAVAAADTAKTVLTTGVAHVITVADRSKSQTVTDPAHDLEVLTPD